MNIPNQSILYQKTYDYQDTYIKEISKPIEQIEIEEIGRAFFSAVPNWASQLFTLRNKIVQSLGLKVGEEIADRDTYLANCQFEIGDQMGLFKIFDKTENELIIGEDDKHLDFRISLMKDKATNSISITTIVDFHNWMGKGYFIPVRPFHRMIVPIMLNNIVQKISKS